MLLPVRPIVFSLGLMVAACGASAPNGGNGTTSTNDAAPSAPVATTPAKPLSEADAQALAEVRERLAKRVPGLEDSELRPTPVDGIFELSRGMAVGYVSADGRFLIEGDLVDLATGRQITEERRREARQAVIAAQADRSITFGPAGEAEHIVTVFTDIDCGYCRKMHDEIDSYNDRGIAIRYLLYPRSGSDTESYRKAVASWCAKDRKATLTKAKQGIDPGTKSCSHPVDSHLLAGRQLGLRGTPMMVLPNGEVVQGYLPAEQLASRLGEVPKADPLAAAPR